MAKDKKNIHVVPDSERGVWHVKIEGTGEVLSTSKTKDDAVQTGVQIAKRNGGELFIHGKDGKIQDRRSYGNDPYPPKG